MAETSRHHDVGLKKNVLLVDELVVVREGIAALIDRDPGLCTAVQVGSAAAALRALTESSIDIVVVDISFDRGDGLELLRQMHRSHPQVPVLVLTVHDEGLYAERAMRAGARGYVIKREPAQHLILGIHQMLAGKTYVSQKAFIRTTDRSSTAECLDDVAILDRLSEREFQVFHRIGRGMSVGEIAAELSLSAKTVEAHREHVKFKLSLKSSRALLRYAIEHGKRARAGAGADA